MSIQHRLTSKAQVTIPKDVRNALGIKPGDLVRFVEDKDGRITITKGEDEGETPEARRARIRAALEALCGKYPVGMSTDEYMRELRGDWEP